MTTHDYYMARCIELAKNGKGTTAPNPLVGSVIVHQNRIIGEGWHHSAGNPHAEVNAIRSVTDPSLLPEATMYVSLEPCSHHGKTPPCSDLIIEKKIPKVVIGTIDPFAKVSGNGIRKLTLAGCDVTVGILEAECLALNKRFFTFHTQKRPYIILKWAMSSDGYLAPNTQDTRKPVWITNPYSRQLVHKWRAEEQSILVGSTTVVKDNPKLTLRDWYGNAPTRMVINRTTALPKDSAILDQSAPTIVITSSSDQRQNDNTLCFESVSSERIEDLIKNICEIAYRHEIQSILVEGGTTTLQGFMEANLWDEARVFTGAHTFLEGIPAPQISKPHTTTQYIMGDVLKWYYND